MPFAAKAWPIASVKLRPRAAVMPPTTYSSLIADFIVSTAAVTDESVHGSLPLKSWSYLSGPACFA